MVGLAEEMRAGCKQVTTVLCGEDAWYFMYGGSGVFSEQGKLSCGKLPIYSGSLD